MKKLVLALVIFFPSLSLAATSLIAGHRGYKALYPENTLLSFQEAVNAGANVVELDVYQSSDGVLYVMHDSTVDRTTNGTGGSEDLAWSYLQTLDAGDGTAYAGRPDTKVPSFSQVLDWAADLNIFLLVEIKGNKNTGAAVADMIQSKGMVNKAWVMSFNSTYMVNVKAQVPALTTGLLNSSSAATAQSTALSGGHNFISLYEGLVTQEVINNAHAAGLEIGVYTVNSPVTMQVMIDRGVDMVTGDDVAMMAGKITSNSLTLRRPANPRRLTADNLTYVGAFRVPSGDLNSGHPSQGLDYGGGVIAYNAQNNSLFIVGHNANQQVAEITIPTPVNSANINDLPTASVIQNLVDITEGNRRWIDLVGGQLAQQVDNPVYIGGLIADPGGLTGSVYSSYDGEKTAYWTFFKSGKNFGTTGDFQGMFKVGDTPEVPQAGFISGYMAPIPSEYQAQLGGDTIGGMANLSVLGRTSWGPSAFAFNRGDIGATTTPATALVYYPEGHRTLGEWQRQVQTQYLAMGDTISGIVFPEGSDSVLFIGKHGQGTSCYGAATDNPAQAMWEAQIIAGGQTVQCGLNTVTVAEASEGIACCYDPLGMTDKGVHAYPYVPQVWAYDVSDLISVANNTAAPWDVVPDVWTLTMPTVDSDFSGGATAYDPATQRVYVVERLADHSIRYGLPLVHVFQLSLNPVAPTDADGDDYYPPTDCDDNDATVNPGFSDPCKDCDAGTACGGSCTPTNGGVEICGDGIDQDCSGADLACGGGSGGGSGGIIRASFRGMIR